MEVSEHGHGNSTALVAISVLTSDGKHIFIGGYIAEISTLWQKHLMNP